MHTAHLFIAKYGYLQMLWNDDVQKSYRDRRGEGAPYVNVLSEVTHDFHPLGIYHVGGVQLVL